MKIISDITQIEAINNAVKLRENNLNSKYCETIKHCTQELYAIPIMQDYLLSLNIAFITQEWLTTSIVEELPIDWTWHFDTLIRIIIPNYLILQNEYLTALIQYAKENNVLNIVLEANSYIYVNYILPDHQYLFDQFPEIKIENKPV